MGAEAVPKGRRTPRLCSGIVTCGCKEMRRREKKEKKWVEGPLKH